MSPEKAISYLLSVAYISFLTSLNIQLSLGGDSISWGQSLTGDYTRVSKEGHFELGFFSLANRDVLMSNSSSSEIKITENGNLALFSSSKKFAWSSDSTFSLAKSTIAVLLDTSNIVLKNSLNFSAIIWQSFDHPTDTLVPGGWIGINKITSEYQSLTSWKNHEDPSPGQFTTTIDPSSLNQFLLQWNGNEIYWSSGVWNGHVYSSLPGMDQSSNFVSTFIDSNDRNQATLTFNLKVAYTRNVKDQFEQIKQRSKTFCSYPKGFEQLSITEWNLNDWISGCKRMNKLQCNDNDNSTSSEKKEFLAVSSKRLPAGSLPLAINSTEECKLACLKTCSCIGYSYDHQCLIWNRNVLSLSKNSNMGILSIRLSTLDIPSKGHKKKSSRIVIIGLCSGLILIQLRKRQDKRIVLIEGILFQFKYFDLHWMTKNFSEMHGQGGFGSNYKGALPNLTAIAVKQLRSVMYEKVVSYMLNGFLNRHLFNMNGVLLEWKTRYQIIVGVAKGLEYLHKKCKDCIIHCDVKQENIVLDSNFCPKVSDFGMAMLIHKNFSRVLTSTKGQPITAKVDVYSYVWAANKLIEGVVRSLLDEKLAHDTNVEELTIVCKVACWCIQRNEANRPSMRLIVMMLEEVIEMNLAPIPSFLMQLTEEEKKYLPNNVHLLYKDNSKTSSEINKEQKII
ncbi:Non-specific serine/threonine protein kinase protein [Dioscorea alata]|uniref:Non-specific serine/threonine protein kinase protein n=1 Tax=Dioscorea alata TaxID=55571 RepID=A0ACB7VA35_DIOAL|nr:Non-specific serine/threonine protein kinase protein [Dioscorea alata]